MLVLIAKAQGEWVLVHGARPLVLNCVRLQRSAQR
jgi:hypothetical protein